MSPHHLFILFIAVAAISPTPTTAVRPSPVSDSFIRTSCSSTQYPSLCEQSLASYAPTVHGNPCSLAQAALSVSIQRAKSACSFVDSLSSARSSSSPYRGPIKDCIDNLRDGVSRLQRSFDEMGHAGSAGSPDYQLHLSNVQTWVSAALTDENTCLDGCKPGTPAGKAVDPNLREALRKHVVELAQVTSNALALVNKVANGQ